jgi:RimJ/RimL family protein N-acetyltransferase
MKSRPRGSNIFRANSHVLNNPIPFLTTMQPILHTPRLTLIQLTDISDGSHHVQYFHEGWSDAESTVWSPHGATHSLAESREWMRELLDKYDIIWYSVFAKTTSSSETADDDELKEHVGNVSLRLQGSGPTLPPPHYDNADHESLRALGYALFASARGNGYATEACQALLKAYAAEKKTGGKRVYVEAGVHEGNPGSERVLERLSFEKLGWKETEKVWLNGAWRSGLWVYGLYV